MFRSVPPPPDVLPLLRYTLEKQCKAMVAATACTRCLTGIRAEGSEWCAGCLEQAERIEESAEAFWRELRAR